MDASVMLDFRPATEEDDRWLFMGLLELQSVYLVHTSHEFAVNVRSIFITAVSPLLVDCRSVSTLQDIYAAIREVATDFFDDGNSA
jgi:hypothetical protein